MTKYPHLAITLGDPTGIGAEIILKALADSSISQDCHLTAIGSKRVLQFTYEYLLQNRNLKSEDLVNPDKIDIIDLPMMSDFTFGQGNAESGAASFAYLDKAIELTLANKFQGIVTAPIAKSLWQAAGHNYPGQTEVLAKGAGVDRFGMLFVANSPHTGWTLRTLLATTHIPLAKVSQTLNPTLMSLKLDLLIDCLKTDFGITRPTIVIAGLNPHSGEEGKLGTEEQEWLNDWLHQAQRARPEAKLIGLVPPDTMWVKPGQAWYGNTDNNPSQAADAYLALYHDQGLIPVKLMAFDRAINTTIGLPFIRTSPDHGTAFDIAGQGVANPNSIKAAIELATELTRRRLN
ncbi:MAG: 4-hydroxythreonine-4-phosphate dehydrogenase PdxA [Xenococcaceae cyanobacterium MO_188.B32]|nr:4-hydroxythreonine-4-phosphate dehydrogenase PdxA [Xenococcaceae cyanobacterium MO_188.B32]